MYLKKNYPQTKTKEHKCYGLLKGFILRSQLNVILEHNLYLTPLHDENYCTKLELIRKSTYSCHDSKLFQVHLILFLCNRYMFIILISSHLLKKSR